MQCVSSLSTDFPLRFVSCVFGVLVLLGTVMEVYVLSPGPASTSRDVSSAGKVVKDAGHGYVNGGYTANEKGRIHHPSPELKCLYPLNSTSIFFHFDH